MKLGDWLKQHEVTQAAFAARIGSDQGHVSDLVRGKVRPHLETVSLIAHHTQGAVGAQDWLLSKKRVPLEKLKQAVRKAAR